jgi:phosphatidylinositol alpha-1,6-mannosyltransferase
VTSVVLAPRHSEAAAFDRGFPHKVVRWPAFPMLPGPRLAREISRMCAVEDADAVLFGAAMPLALMAGAVRRRTGLPIVACTHGVEPALARMPGGAMALRHIAARVTVLTAVSNWAERRLRAALGPHARIERLPSGIDPVRFRTDVDGAWVRRRHGLDPGPVIVCVSRLVRRKGQDRLIRALPRIAEAFPAVKLVLVGGGPDRGRLHRLAGRNGVDARVVFTGPVTADELPAYFAAGDIFAVPCRSRLLGLENEALGAVFLQAAAVGRAAIAGRSGGAPEAVIHGRTGVVVDERSAEAIAGAAVSLLRSPGDARALAARAAARVHGEMSWAKIAQRLHSWLIDAADERRGRAMPGRPAPSIARAAGRRPDM